MASKTNFLSLLLQEIVSQQKHSPVCGLVSIYYNSLKGRLRQLFARPSGVGGIIVYGTDIQTEAHTYGTDIQTDTHTYGTDIQTDAHTYGTDIQTDTPMGQTYRQTHMACEK